MDFLQILNLFNKNFGSTCDHQYIDNLLFLKNFLFVPLIQRRATCVGG